MAESLETLIFFRVLQGIVVGPLIPLTMIVAQICGPIQSLAARSSLSTCRSAPWWVVILALLVVGIGCLQVMLDRGKELDWFNSTEIVVLTVVSVVSLAVPLYSSTSAR